MAALMSSITAKPFVGKQVVSKANKVRLARPCPGARILTGWEICGRDMSAWVCRIRTLEGARWGT